MNTLWQPSPWLIFPCFAAGLLLIWWDARRGRVPSSVPTPVAALSTPIKAPAPAFVEQANLRLQKRWTETTITPRMESWPIYVITDEVKLLRLAMSVGVIIVHKLTHLTTETDDLANAVVSLLRNATSGYRRGKLVMSSEGFVNEAKRLKDMLVRLRGNDVWVYAEQHEKHLPESWDPPKELDWENTESQAIVAFGPPGEYGEEAVEVKIDHGYAHFSPPLSKLF